MSDWRNTVPMIVNKTRFQLYATKYDDLEKVKQLFQEHDRNNNGNLDKHELSLLMKKIGIFLSTQELTAVYAVFDLNKDGRVNFPEFVQTLRNAMSDERIATVKKAFQKLDKAGKGHLSLDFLISNYNAELHPRVRTREKTVEQVQTEFERVIRNKSKDGHHISELEFLDYYADVSACLPTEREDHFNNTIHSTWAPKGFKGYMISTDRVLDIENRIFEKIRQLTLPKENEGTTLRKRFAGIDKFNIGVVDFLQFKKLMHELGFTFSDDDLQAVFFKFSGGQDKLVYSELCDYFRDLGTGMPPNKNPAYTTYRKNPDELLDRIRRDLRARGHFQISRLRSIFERSDKDQSGSLTRDEFVWVTKEIGLQLTKTEFEKIFRHFDRNSDNKVSYAEFIGYFLQDLNANREQHLTDIFERLAGGRDKTLTVQRISQCFDPRHDPEVEKVRAGYMTKNTLLSSFIELFPNPKQITLKDWLKVLTGISAHFDSDEAFHGYIEGIWSFN